MDRHTHDADQQRATCNPAKRHATRVYPPALIDVGCLDYTRRHAAEAAAYARQRVYGPLPALPSLTARVSDWVRDTVPGHRQDEWDIIAWRQHAENALCDGNQRPVRQEVCPCCDCLGLVWDRQTELVVCLNADCTTDDGAPVTWTLRQFAVIAATRARRRQAGAS